MSAASDRTQLVEFDVAIVGYGPVGQAPAALLGRAGHRVVAFERFKEIYRLPRGPSGPRDRGVEDPDDGSTIMEFPPEPSRPARYRRHRSSPTRATRASCSERRSHASGGLAERGRRWTMAVRAAPGCHGVTNLDGRRVRSLDPATAMALHKPGPAAVALPVWTSTSTDAALLLPGEAGGPPTSSRVASVSSEWAIHLGQVGACSLGFVSTGGRRRVAGRRGLVVMVGCGVGLSLWGWRSGCCR